MIREEVRDAHQALTLDFESRKYSRGSREGLARKDSSVLARDEFNPWLDPRPLKLFRKKNSCSSILEELAHPYLCGPRPSKFWSSKPSILDSDNFKSLIFQGSRNYNWWLPHLADQRFHEKFLLFLSQVISTNILLWAKSKYCPVNESSSKVRCPIGLFQHPSCWLVFLHRYQMMMK